MTSQNKNPLKNQTLETHIARTTCFKKYLNIIIPSNPDKHGGNNNYINFENLNNDLKNKTLVQ